jgi:hypothetical protein
LEASAAGIAFSRSGQKTESRPQAKAVADKLPAAKRESFARLFKGGGLFQKAGRRTRQWE